MKRYRVVYSDDAEDDLHAIGLYLTVEASPAVADCDLSTRIGTMDMVVADDIGLGCLEAAVSNVRNFYATSAGW